MVSPELLRRYPFFGFLNTDELKAVAMLAEEVDFQTGDVILEVGKPAGALYFLIDGRAELYYVAAGQYNLVEQKAFYISDVNPGEIFGISALIEPYVYTGTIHAAGPCRVLKIDASALRAVCEVDIRMARDLMRQTAKAAMERLEDTRVQLAAARA